MHSFSGTYDLVCKIACHVVSGCGNLTLLLTLKLTAETTSNLYFSTFPHCLHFLTSLTYTHIKYTSAHSIVFECSSGNMENNIRHWYK